MRRTIPRNRHLLGACIAILVLAGCSSKEISEPTVDVAPPPVVQTEPPAPAPAPEPAPIVQKEPAETPADKEPKIPVTAVSYEPPFPGRTDPFEAPKQARSSVRTGEGEEDDAVELNGFVLVDTPRAILSIDGQIVLLAEGGERYGVEVISIDSPRVILQRGGTRLDRYAGVTGLSHGLLGNGGGAG